MGAGAARLLWVPVALVLQSRATPADQAGGEPRAPGGVTGAGAGAEESWRGSRAPEQRGRIRQVAAGGELRAVSGSARAEERQPDSPARRRSAVVPWTAVEAVSARGGSRAETPFRMTA